MRSIASLRGSKSQAGFTLAELAVVIVLFSLLVPVIALSVNILQLLNRSAEATSVVSGVVENQIELLRTKSYDDVSIGTTNFSSSLPSSIKSPKSASYTVAQVAGKDDLKQVDVEVSYAVESGTRTVRFKTYINKETTSP